MAEIQTETNTQKFIPSAEISLDLQEEKLNRYNINKKSLLSFLSLAILIDMFGFSLILPILPSIASDFGATAFMIGIITAANSLTALICGPIWGSLSDKYGRKPILIINQIGTLSAFIVLATAQSVEVIILSRIIDGIFGGQFPVIRSIISDVTTPETRTKDMGTIMGVSMLGLIIGPVLGGVLGNSNWRIPAYLTAALSVISIILTVKLLRETMPQQRRFDLQLQRTKLKTLNNGQQDSIFNKAVVIRLLETFLFTVIFQVFISTNAIIMNYRFGANPAAIGWLNAEFAIINIICITKILPMLTKKFSNQQLMVTGVILLGIGMVIYGLATAPWILYILFVIPFTLGSALLRPIINTNLTKAVAEDQQGQVSGWSTSIQSLGEIFTPLLATSFLDHDLLSLFGITISSYWAVALLGIAVVGMMLINVIYDNMTFKKIN
ncbi:Multidrug resistance protein MdtG [Candidatus Lokiarchaeum ossiferum]|uniref:Multidrug resistance protein MdtG n=1 Tax=Candidatus Lokiarchaeum ossiferum TaxID=2951803 RepID=A0ABY6HT17_9ARCH|nr:Multidrug resistance protein MdtG [Candidatus Lokiarchaeum sp. B-35]